MTEERAGECYLGLKSEGPVPERSLRLLSFSPSVLQLSAGRKPKSVKAGLNELSQTTCISLTLVYIKTNLRFPLFKVCLVDL